MSAAALGMMVGVLLIVVLVILVFIARNLYVCSPSEVLIFSGRRWKSPDDKELGFRVVRGGRGMRMPLFEVVDRMQLTNMAIELGVQGAYSKGGVPLNVTAIANIKTPSEEPLLHNAIERFLGYSQQQ